MVEADYLTGAKRSAGLASIGPRSTLSVNHLPIKLMTLRVWIHGEIEYTFLS